MKSPKFVSQSSGSYRMFYCQVFNSCHQSCSNMSQQRQTVYFSEKLKIRSSSQLFSMQIGVTFRRILLHLSQKLTPAALVFCLVVLLKAAIIQLLEVQPNKKPELQESISDESEDDSLLVIPIYIENSQEEFLIWTFAEK